MDPVVSVGSLSPTLRNRQHTNSPNLIWLQRPLRIPDHVDNESTDADSYEG